MVVLAKFAAGMAFSASLAGTALAHPGEKHDPVKIKRELAFMNMVAAKNRRALESCHGSSADVALKQRAVARREAKVNALREKRGLTSKRSPIRRRDEEDLAEYLTVSHESSESYDLSTDPSVLFSENATCVIVPETTIGPYWVAGELIRSDVTDGEEGVPIHMDVQFVDVSSCEGVSDLLVDMWHCNATGVYSGVSATGQGGLDSTFLRGVQQTDSDGVAEFDSIYPGHYTSRTNHIHVKTTTDATIYDNGTYGISGTTTHIGQLFFDQDLTTVVEATSPYTTNEQELTTNEDDQIAAVEATEEYDPFLSYVYLGDDVSDGLLMWITVGIDTSADYSDQASAAAFYYEDGGVDNEDSDVGGGGGGGEGGPEGDFSGALPSGTDVPTDVPTEAVGGNATTTTTALSTSIPSSGGGRSCKVPGRRRARKN